MKALDLDGLFWLEGTPEERVGGRLRFDAGTGASLDLIASFDDDVQRSSLSGPVRIHGTTEDGRVTLENCFQTSISSSTLGISRERYDVPLVLSGGHLTDADLDGFVAVHMELTDSKYWVRTTGIRHKTTDILGGVSIHYTPPDEAKAHSSLGELTLSIGAEVQSTISASSLRDRYHFGIAFPTQRNRGEALAPCTSIRDLITMGTDRPSNFASVTLSHAAHGQVELYSRVAGANVIDEVDDSYPPRMVFSFDDVGGVDGLAKWLETAERFETVIRLLVSHWYFPDSYTQNRFRDIITAAEALERIRTGQQETPLKPALRKILAEAGDAGRKLVPVASAWADEIAKMRAVNVVHPGLGKTVDAAKMFYLSESVYLLVVMSLLRECGVAEQVLANFSNHEKFQWIALQLRATP